MEIQKIFSDISGEERLYSVLMSEKEAALFSEIQGGGLIGSTIFGPLFYGGKKIHDHHKILSTPKEKETARNEEHGKDIKIPVKFNLQCNMTKNLIIHTNSSYSFDKKDFEHKISSVLDECFEEISRMTNGRISKEKVRKSFELTGINILGKYGQYALEFKSIKPDYFFDYPNLRTMIIIDFKTNQIVDIHRLKW